MRKYFRLLLIFVFLLAAVAVAEAQQPKKVPLIGALMGTTSSFAQPYIEAGRRALRELGYVEGKNILIEYRFGEGQARERLPGLAAELVKLKVDVIVAVGDPAIDVARRATSTIPIVMLAAGDPVGGGWVASLAHPGGNITGTTFLSSELAGKRLELLKETAPGLRRVAMLWNAADLGMTLRYEASATTAQALGVIVQPLGVREPEDFEEAFGAMMRELPDAILMVSDVLTILNRRRVYEFAAAHRLPAIYENDFFSHDGGLMSYGPDTDEICERAAGLVDRILKGAKPADLPFEQPTRFRFVINLGAARALGLTIPPSLLARADEVIE